MKIKIFIPAVLALLCLSLFNINAQSTSTTNIYQLSSDPVIDGEADAVWTDFPELAIVHMDGTPVVVRTPDANLGATFKIGWRGSKLFFLVKVTDDIPFYDVASAEKYFQDYVSIYFNLNSTHLTDAGSYSSSLPQWYFLANLNPAPELMNMAGHGGPSNENTGWAWPGDQSKFPAGKELAWTATATGYNAEIMLDFSDAGWLYTGTLTDGVTLGFDVEVNDVDELGGGRTQIFWSNSGVENLAYDNVVGFGSGTIVASAPNDNNSGTVSSVDVNPKTLNLGIGSKSQLTATVLPSYATNKAVNWRSSNIQVATVSTTGQVTGIGVGDAIITATTVDQEKTSTCSVKVSNLIKILPFGESTTDGGGGGSYRKVLSDLLVANHVAFDFIGSKKLPASAAWDTDNQGMSGNACKDLSAWIKANSTTYQADIVLLWEGTNDCGWGWQYYGTPISSLSTLIDDICQNQTNAEVIVSTIPMMGSNAYIPPMASGGANASATNYNAAMEGLINTKKSQGKKVHFLDTRGVILSSELNGDGIHPTQSGYDKMASYWFNAMKPYLGLSTGLESSAKLGKNDQIKLYVDDKRILADLSALTGTFEISVFDMFGKKMYAKNIDAGKIEQIEYNASQGVYIVKINNQEFRQATKIVMN